VSNDEYRRNLNEAFMQNGFVYASNGHTLIKGPAELCKKRYQVLTEEETKIPNFEKIMNEVEAMYVSELSIDEVLPCIDNIKVKILGYTSKCEKCNGDGEIECDCCGHSNECGSCRGEGEIKHPGKVMIRDVQFKNEDGEIIYSVDINGNNYNPKYLELLMFAMLATNNSTCKYYNGSNYRSIFKFGEIEVLIMKVLKP
jgi:hypothetical protein